MAYEILVTATTFAVTNSSTQLAVTVTATATPTFTITNAVSNFTITNQITTATIYTDAVELTLVDLNNFWKGEWTAGNYLRGDIVTYQYSQYFLDDWNADVTAVYTSTVVPPSDATWIRFNWHEAPFSVLTVTNSASIGNDLSVSDDVTVGGDLTVSGGLGIGGAGSGNGLTIASTATFNGAARFNSTASFYGDFQFLNTLSNFTLANLTVTNQLFVDERFLINGLLYPKDKGLYGQVLFTNGSTAADWVNLGDLVFWSLSADLYTNGFNIKTNSNQDLRIGVSTNTGSWVAYTWYKTDGTIRFECNNLYAQVPDIDLIGANSVDIIGANSLYLFSQNTATLAVGSESKLEITEVDPFTGYSTFKNRVSGYITDYVADTELDITTDPNATYSLITRRYIYLKTQDRDGSYDQNITLDAGQHIYLKGRETYSKVILSGTDLQFKDGTVQTTAAINTGSIIAGLGLSSAGGTTGSKIIYLDPATASTIGGVKVAANSGLSVDGNGSLTLTFGTQTGVYSIFAGNGILVSSNTGSVTISNAWTSTVQRVYDFKAGTGINVALASGTVYGVPYTTATYSVNTASAANLGVIKVGSNLSIEADGTLNSLATTTVGILVATEDIVTNGFAIKLTTSTTTTNLVLNSATTYLRNIGGDINILSNHLLYSGNTARLTGSGWDVRAESQRFDIEAANVSITGTNDLRLITGQQFTVSANAATIAATTTTLGSNANNSTLRVQRIYNYAGNYAPFFPAGVQFQDNTVQFTAFQPDQGLL